MGISQHEKDEYMERLWYMREDREESLDALKEALGEGFDAAVLDGLTSDGLVAVTEDECRITLTEKGVDRARRVIRAHRIAERLIHDVLGNRFESGACEFEHMIDTELVDSICTLLGHPRECPHRELQMLQKEWECLDLHEMYLLLLFHRGKVFLG